MPTYMKVLTPLTVVLLLGGYMLLEQDVRFGVIPIVIVMLAWLLRFVTNVILMVGPQTIIGYTFAYVFEVLDRRFRYFSLLVVGLIGAAMLWALYMSIMEELAKH